MWSLMYFGKIYALNWLFFLLSIGIGKYKRYLKKKFTTISKMEKYPK